MGHSFRQSKHLLRAASISSVAIFLPVGCIAFLCAVLAGSGVSAAEKPAASAKVKRGETIFKTQCIGCHNKEPGDTTPFGPPNLHGILGSKSQLTPQEAAETIKQGKGVMPSFATKLNSGDISDVVAYLKTQ